MELKGSTGPLHHSGDAGCSASIIAPHRSVVISVRVRWCIRCWYYSVFACRCLCLSVSLSLFLFLALCLSLCLSLSVVLSPGSGSIILCCSFRLATGGHIEFQAIGLEEF